MIVKEHKIYIYWRVRESSYAYANKEGLDEEARMIGSSVSAVSKILSNAEEQKVLMQDIIGLSPNNEHWGTKLANYWHSISEPVGANGRELEIGFIYDIASLDKVPYVKLINENLAKDKQITSDQDIVDYFNNRLAAIKTQFNKAATVANKLDPIQKDKAIKTAYKVYYDMVWKVESERYKFGSPIDTADYILYRYCLGYSHVANSFELANNSSNIRFYLHSEADIQRAKEARYKAEKDRMTTYIKVIQSLPKVENILYAMGKGDELKTLDETDQFLLLEKLSKDKAQQFVTIANDKNLEAKGLIEKYIAYSLLRRLEGSQVIVDASDPALTIGNNIDEAITFFSNKKNDVVIKEYSAKFKGLPK